MSRHSSHQTQWAAQFAVASELCKRGYEVALTMGNHPTRDIMVVSPNGRQFGVDVKGLYKRNFWWVREKSADERIFYVFALVSKDEGNRFFILSQEQVTAGIEAEKARARAAAEKAGRDPEKAAGYTGVTFPFAADFEDCWEILPA